MLNLAHANNQIQCVTDFYSLVTTDFINNINALCWKRNLIGDFKEIINKLDIDGNITAIEHEDLIALNLTEQGKLARETILNDWNLLKAHGAQPTLNVIKQYDTDNIHHIIATDVYSFHVDRSPVPTDTFLCTYIGAPSEILPHSQAIQKIQIPEIRLQLLNEFDGTVEEFENYLTDEFLDLHYQPIPNANIISLGIGNLWRLAVDHPESKVPPCVHRAPMEKNGEYRLLLIC
jgi:hypothetical protein